MFSKRHPREGGDPVNQTFAGSSFNSIHGIMSKGITVLFAVGVILSIL
jgi:hypothetical protein